MNSNTIAGFQGGVGRNKIPNLVLATVTETAISVGTDSGTAVAVLSVPLQTSVTGAATPLDPNVNPALITNQVGRQFASRGSNAPYFTSDSFNLGRPFKVRVNGTFNSGVAANDIQIGLYLGTSATLGSNSVISIGATTGTAGKFGVVAGHFSTEFYLIWDVTSGKLDGILENAIIGASGVTGTVIAPVALTQTSAAAPANLNFVASVKFNVANAANAVQISEFTLESN